MKDYFNISYDDAKKFIIDELSDDVRNKLYDKYEITESIDLNGIIYTEPELLADAITDDDLLKSGFKLKENINKSEKIEESLYNYDLNSVINYLASLDEYTLEDLLHEYDATSIEDLAIAITDYDLEKFGFSEDNNSIVENEDIETNYSYDHYDDHLDFLDDVDSDIKYELIDYDNLIFSSPNEIEYNKFKSCLDPNLIQYCDIVEDYPDNDLIIFTVTPIDYDVPVSEEVIINTELNPNLFDENHALKKDVRQQLIDYADGFIEKMNNADVDFAYSDICLVGSNAGYLYRPDSDIDIHFISANPIDELLFDKLVNEFDIYEAENPFYIGESAVELGVEDGYNIVMNNLNPRRYSIIDNIWVDDSDKNEQYTVEDITTVEGYEEVVDNYTQRINDVVDNDEYADAVALKQEIRQNRSNDLANIGALSMGNVVYKELRESGAYGKLWEYIHEKEAFVDNDE